MPVIGLDALAEGTDTSFTLGAGSDKVSAVTTNDSDTSYIQNVTGLAQRQSYTHTPLPGDAISLNTHNVRNRSRTTAAPGAQSINGYVKLSGSRTDGTPIALTNSYVLNTDVDLAKPGGGTFDVTTLNAAEMGVFHTSAAAGDDRTSTLSWQVDYNAAPGGIASMVVQWLGPVIGAAIILREIPALIAAFNSATRGRLIITGREIEATWRDLRDHHHPVWSFAWR